jgi:hypothetical protein
MKPSATLLFCSCTLAGLAFPGTAHAQIVGKSVPTFTTTAGTLVHLGDTLRLGRGTLPTGNFNTFTCRLTCLRVVSR